MSRGFSRLIILAMAIIGASFIYWLLKGPSVPPRALDGLSGDIRRGAYMARVAGCIGCHTDIKGGGPVLAGGAALKTEFGTFYAPNITPASQSGIGSWKLADFSAALTAGSGADGSHLYPAFPYDFYAKLNNQDIVDLWAAVQSVPAVETASPKHDLSFPFSFRRLNAAWKRFFLDNTPLETPENASSLWQRGQYLTEGPAHCGACHTPRNFLGGIKKDQALQGGIGPDGKKTPAITAEALRKNGWRRTDLIYALQTGILPDGDAFGGAMAEIVQDSTRFWTDEDLQALATYLLGEDEAG